MTGSFHKEEYRRRVEKRAARSPVGKNMLHAFWVGGIVCVLGELLDALFLALGLPLAVTRPLVTVTLIFLAALFTAIGWFDRIARFAGAGTLVPVTGFANSVVSPAIDTKSEGYVPGVGAKIFTVAGPVLLYGTLAGALYGILYYIWGLWPQ